MSKDMKRIKITKSRYITKKKTVTIWNIKEEESMINVCRKYYLDCLCLFPCLYVIVNIIQTLFLFTQFGIVMLINSLMWNKNLENVTCTKTIEIL